MGLVVLTQAESTAHDDMASATSRQSSDVVDAVNIGVINFEDTDHIVGPSRNAGDRKQTKHPRNHAQSVEHEGD